MWNSRNLDSEASGTVSAQITPEVTIIPVYKAGLCFDFQK